MRAWMTYTAHAVWDALQGIPLTADGTKPSRVDYQEWLDDEPILSIFNDEGVMTQIALGSDRCIECGNTIALGELLSVTEFSDEPWYVNDKQVVLIPKSDWCLTRLEHLDCVQNNPGGLDAEERRMKLLGRATVAKERQRAEDAQIQAQKAQIKAANKAMWVAAQPRGRRR